MFTVSGLPSSFVLRGIETDGCAAGGGVAVGFEAELESSWSERVLEVKLLLLRVFWVA